MKVSFDITRVLHLCLLIALTIVGGQLLTRQFDWSGLSAYGTACTIVTQVSNVLMKLWSGELKGVIDEHATASETKKRETGGNPKKKRG